MTKMKLLTMSACLLTMASTGSAAIIFSDDFNSYTPGDATVDAGFTANYATNGAWNIGATGLSGSNGLVIPSTADRYLTYTGGLALDESTPLMITMFFERPESASSNVAVPEFGFADSSGGNVDGGIAVRLNGSSPQWQLRLSGSTNQSGDSLGLAAGWYQMSVTLSYNADLDQITMGGTLFNSDNAGNVGTQVSSFAPTAVANPFGDSEIFAGMRVQNNGVSNMDNLTITAIPEPSTFAMLAAVCALGLVALRRRR